MEEGKSNGFWSIVSIAVASAVISLCSCIDGCGQTTTTTEPEPIQIHCNTATNDTERTGQNLDWFTNGSNYIWDGWKIK